MTAPRVRRRAARTAAAAVLLALAALLAPAPALAQYNVEHITVVSTGPYEEGDHIEFRVQFNGAVKCLTKDKKWYRLKFTIGDTEVQADYHRRTLFEGRQRYFFPVHRQGGRRGHQRHLGRKRRPRSAGVVLPVRERKRIL